jgi:periplasmic glucans biosynthesis protein
MVDFAGGELEGLPRPAGGGRAVTASRGEVHHLQARPLPDAAAGAPPSGSTPTTPTQRPAPVSALRGETISETWNHVWYPDEQR